MVDRQDKPVLGWLKKRVSERNGTEYMSGRIGDKWVVCFRTKKEGAKSDWTVFEQEERPEATPAPTGPSEGEAY